MNLKGKYFNLILQFFFVIVLGKSFPQNYLPFSLENTYYVFYSHLYLAIKMENETKSDVRHRCSTLKKG